MVATSIDIANIALAKTGGKQITALSDNTAVNVSYDMVLDEVLTEHPWTFAQKRSALVSTTAPTVYTEDGLTYLFTKPTDVLKINFVNSSSAILKLEATGILCNESALSILYTARITDVTTYPQSFVAALATKLAAQVCFSVTNDMKKTEALMQEYENMALPHAMSVDSQQGSSDWIQQDEWENARLSGSGWMSAKRGADTWIPYT